MANNDTNGENETKTITQNLCEKFSFRFVSAFHQFGFHVTAKISKQFDRMMNMYDSVRQGDEVDAEGKIAKKTFIIQLLFCCHSKHTAHLNRFQMCLALLELRI